MEHYFNRMQPTILNEHNIDTLNHLLNQFIDEVKREIEAWSQRGSGWVIDEILEAFINVAQYQPLRGGSYLPLPKKLQNKKAIINVQNKDRQSLFEMGASSRIISCAEFDVLCHDKFAFSAGCSRFSLFLSYEHVLNDTLPSKKCTRLTASCVSRRGEITCCFLIG